MVILLVFMHLTRHLFVKAKFLLMHVTKVDFIQLANKVKYVEFEHTVKLLIQAGSPIEAG